MNDAVTIIIVGARAVLDFEHKDIFPSVKNIADEVIRLSIWKRHRTNMKPPISRLHSSVLIILIHTFPFLCFSVPSALSLVESTSMIPHKG